MSSHARKSWGLVGRAFVCLLLLAWIFHAIFIQEARSQFGALWDGMSWQARFQAAWTSGPRALLATAGRAEPSAWAIAFAWGGLAQLLGMVRWRHFLRVQGLDLGWRRAAEISLAAHFFNSFLLGSSGGDLMKAYYTARETHHKKTEAVLTVFADRLVGLWAMLLFAVLMLIPNYELFVSHRGFRQIGLLMLVMLGGCSVVVFLAFHGGLSKRFSAFQPWLRRLPRGARIEAGLQSCRRFGREPLFIAKCLALSLVLNMCCVFQVMAMARGLDMHVPARVWFAVVPIVFCLSAIPITPSGLGVRENLFVFLLAAPAVGAEPTAALSLSLLVYALSLAWSAVGGVVYLTQRGHGAWAPARKEAREGAGNEAEDD